MPDRDALSPRQRDVWECLDRVADPELDEMVTELGFIEAVTVAEDGAVRVAFRLPTYWCSPNFAFLMADGIRREVSALPWVRSVEVRLEDHLCAEEMNAAVNAGRSFADAFALREHGGDLAEVRETFERKAFQRRQEAVLLALRGLGFTQAELAAMTLGELDGVAFDDPASAHRRTRYREVLTGRGLAARPVDPAFPDLAGRPLTESGWTARMGDLRAVRINMEFGSALCRSLGRTRYKEAVMVDGEPTLVDFITGPPSAPPAAAAPSGLAGSDVTTRQTQVEDEGRRER